MQSRHGTAAPRGGLAECRAVDEKEKDEQGKTLAFSEIEYNLHTK